MALLADRSLDAGSNLVEGTGTSSITFTMPGNVVLSVESVVAHIDTTVAGATTATLTIRDSSGVVIAEVAQGGTIDAGESDGIATWALRLADSSIGSASGFIRYDFDNVGEWLHIQTTGPGGAFPMWLEDLAGELRLSSDDGAGGGQITLRSPFIRADTAGVSLRLLDSGETFFDCAGAASWDFVGFETDVTGDTVFTSTGDFTIDALSIQLDGPVDQHNGNASFEMQAGGTFTVKDHLGNPKIRWTEGTNDLHLPAGGTIIFDL